MEHGSDELTGVKDSKPIGEGLTLNQSQRLSQRLAHVAELFDLDEQLTEALLASASMAMATPIQNTSDRQRALKTFSNDLLKRGVTDELLAVAICEAGNIIHEGVLRYDWKIDQFGVLTQRIRIVSS